MLLDTEALQSAAIFLREGKATTPSAQFFQQFLSGVGLLSGTPEARLKTCCILTYFLQLQRSPGDKTLKDYWAWGRESKLDDRFLSAAINLGNDFLTAWYDAQKKAIAHTQPTTLQAPTQIQPPEPNPFGAIAPNGPDKIIPTQEDQGDQIVSVINQAIATDGIEFEVLSKTHGVRVSEYAIRQVIERKDGSKPRILPPEKLVSLASTLRVYASASNPAIFPTDNAIIVQVAKSNFKPVPIENYLTQSGKYWQGRCDRPLEIPTGVGTNNKPVKFTLDSHALIAGSTGGGKTSLQDSILVYLFFRYPPNLLRIALVDVQQINFAEYDGHPSLLGGRVLSTADDIESALGHIYALQAERESLMLSCRARDFLSYNQGVTAAIARNEATTEDYLPFILFMVDEQAEASSLFSGREYTDSLRQVARAFRKYGIHLILATQRPSKETGGAFPPELAANVPIRIALRTSDPTNSEIILGSGYKMAANLAGKGDGYLLCPEYPDPVRFQSYWADPTLTVRKLCDRFRGQRYGQYPEELTNHSLGPDLFPVPEGPETIMERSPDVDPRIQQAIIDYTQTQSGRVTPTAIINYLSSQGLLKGTWEKKKALVESLAYLWGG